MAASYPLVILQPFADTGDKNVIPNTPSPTPGLASYEEGFPPITRIKIQDGGKPPAGKDFNGVLNEITQHTVWGGAGGLYRFDASLAAFIGGYSIGMVLQSNDGLNSYRSLVNNNTVDFNSVPSSIGVQWEFYAGASDGNAVTSVSTTGGTVTLTSNQAAANIIIVSGVLASASTIVFPAITNRQWKLINNTTGAFSMVAKAPTGQSLTMSQGFTNTVFYDGVQLVFPDHDSGLDSPALRGSPTAPTQAAGTDNTTLATTAFAKHMDSPAFVGVPTAPTPPTNTNTTQIPTTAFVQNVVSAATVNIVPQYVTGPITAGSTGDLWTNTRGGAFTITLPDPPVNENILTFRDVFGTWGTRNLTINPGTKTIRGVAESLVANVSGRTFGMWYDQVETTWKLM